MASLLHNHSHLHYNSSLSIPISNLHWTRNLHPSRRRAKFSGKARVLAFRVNHKGRLGVSSFPCFCRTGTEVENLSLLEESQQRPFDINLAVILAGFAFEAYTSPPENFGKREVDAAGCMTVYLSESFVREIYDGQLFIKLKKGTDLPAMDPWGTSDPYVVFQLDGQVVKSKTKWGTKQPTWNEDFTLNIKEPSTKYVQVYGGRKEVEKNFGGYDIYWKNFLFVQSVKAIDSIRKEFFSLLKDISLVNEYMNTYNAWSLDELDENFMSWSFFIIFLFKM